MNREERIAAQRQAEKAARRHRDFVDRLRAQRTEERTAQQRAAERRQELLSGIRAQLLAQRSAEKSPTSPPRENNQPERAADTSTRATRTSDRKALTRPETREKKIGRPVPRTECTPVRKQSRSFQKESTRNIPGEARNPLRDASRTRQEPPRPRENRPSPKTDYRDQSARAQEKQTQLRQFAAGQRIQQHRELRSGKHAARAEKQEQRRQQAQARSADRSGFLETRAQRKQIRETLRTRHVEAHRELRANANAAKQRSLKLRTAVAASRAQEHRDLVAAQPLLRAAAVSSSVTSQVYESADSLPWLSTAQSFIVDANGNPVSLRGVSVEGLDDIAPAPGQTVAGALSLDAANVAALIDWWGINLVRIPFRPSTILSGVGPLSDADILQGLDDAISALAQASVYTLLAVRIPPAPGATTTPLPDSTVFDCLRLLAQRYEYEPGVLFEIYSAPLPVQGDWLAAAPVLIGAIRQQHPASLLFVGNGSGGSDCSGLPLRFTTGDPIPNLVYTIRVASLDDFSLNAGISLGALAHSFPVCAMDWSILTSGNIDRRPESTAALFSRDGLGWSAGSWNAEPRLVRNSGIHNFLSTRWGNAVQRAMLLPVRQPFTRLLPRERNSL